MSSPVRAGLVHGAVRPGGGSLVLRRGAVSVVVGLGFLIQGWLDHRSREQPTEVGGRWTSRAGQAASSCATGPRSIIASFVCRPTSQCPTRAETGSPESSLRPASWPAIRCRAAW